MVLAPTRAAAAGSGAPDTPPSQATVGQGLAGTVLLVCLPPARALVPPSPPTLHSLHNPQGWGTMAPWSWHMGPTVSPTATSKQPSWGFTAALSCVPSMDPALTWGCGWQSPLCCGRVGWRARGWWKNYSLVVGGQQPVLPHHVPPLAWPGPHPSPRTAMPATGFLAAEWQRGRVPQPHGQWGPLARHWGVPAAREGQWVGSAVLGSCVRDPKSPRPPEPPAPATTPPP